MSDEAIVPVIVGLVVGIAFVVAFSWALGLNVPLAQPPPISQNDQLQAAIIITQNLNEVNEFTDNYPTARTTVYFITTCSDESCSSLSRIPSIIEYSYREGGRYSDLRIEISPEAQKAVFFQLRCITDGSKNDSIEVHGPRLEDISEFLQNGNCPK